MEYYGCCCEQSARRKLYWFLAVVELYWVCPLSVCLYILMDRVSWYSFEEDSVWFGALRTTTDVVLLVSTQHDLHQDSLQMNLKWLRVEAAPSNLSFNLVHD